ncbi:unnamed protein product [Heterobilharzia americana]|nr:unnamed protein product [Heterobilharzia americana]CAH8462861.1 unnamed protein product [Heterobilharzia americana]
MRSTRLSHFSQLRFTTSINFLALPSNLRLSGTGLQSESVGSESISVALMHPQIMLLITNLYTKPCCLLFILFFSSYGFLWLSIAPCSSSCFSSCRLVSCLEVSGFSPLYSNAGLPVDVDNN